MAAPHIIALSKVGFNSKTRSVYNLSLNVAGIDVFNDTSQTPMGGIEAPVSGPAYANMSFTTRMNPSGSSGGAKTPPDALLFKACGFTETVATTVSTTYALTDPPVYTAVALESSIGNGYKQPCSNALGSCVLRWEPGSPGMIDWNFTGTYTAPTEAAISDALSNGGAAPKSVGTITIAGDTLIVKRASIAVNAGNNGPNYDLAASNGVANPVGTAQFPVFDATVQFPALATNNYITDLTAAAGTLSAISLAIGTGAGYVITTTMKGYLIGVPELQNIGGVLNARLLYRMDWVTGSPLAIAYT